MKKDNVVIKQLKSLIGSLIIFLIIMAGVLVTILYQPQEEQTEVIKLNGYEGEAGDIDQSKYQYRSYRQT